MLIIMNKLLQYQQFSGNVVVLSQPDGVHSGERRKEVDVLGRPLEARLRSRAAARRLVKIGRRRQIFQEG
jgi:hypothetical protein